MRGKDKQTEKKERGRQRDWKERKGKTETMLRRMNWKETGRETSRWASVRWVDGREKKGEERWRDRERESEREEKEKEKCKKAQRGKI